MSKANGAIDSDVRAFIDGKFIETGKWTENRNPADTRQLIGRVVACEPAQVAAAVDAAKRALPAWKAMPAPARANILFRAWQLLAQRTDEIARALSMEEGKIFAEAKGEVGKAVKVLEFTAGEGRRFGGEVLPSEMPQTLCYTVRQPLGVVGLITPWNFPVAIPVWKLAPALIAGNTIVLKAAEQTPWTAQLVAQVFIDAGLPPGVLNVIHGAGEVVGHALVTHPDVSAISFTGSNAVGKLINRQCAELHKKCQCEMGGKNALVVLADADLELAAAATIEGAFGSTGQRCTATSRVVVDASVHDKFVELLIAGAKKITVGNPLAEGIMMGPSVDAEQFAQVHRYIDIAQQEGATLRCGGTKLTAGDLSHGYFTAPTIFTDVRPQMRIAQEEAFGPILSVLRVSGYDEAIAATNGVQYGLSSSVYTRDLQLAMRFVQDVETGITHVNSPTLGGEVQLPFGGIKATGVGEREMGAGALDFYSELKTVYIDYTGSKRAGNVY